MNSDAAQKEAVDLIAQLGRKAEERRIALSGFTRDDEEFCCRKGLSGTQYVRASIHADRVLPYCYRLRGALLYDVLDAKRRVCV